MPISHSINIPEQCDHGRGWPLDFGRFSYLFASMVSSENSSILLVLFVIFSLDEVLFPMFIFLPNPSEPSVIASLPRIWQTNVKQAFLLSILSKAGVLVSQFGISNSSSLEKLNLIGFCSNNAMKFEMPENIKYFIAQ